MIFLRSMSEPLYTYVTQNGAPVHVYLEGNRLEVESSGGGCVDRRSYDVAFLFETIKRPDISETIRRAKE
jgi:hypothetical protein